MSESVNTRQLRSRLGSYLTQVEKGLTLVVTRQGQAIAELRPYGVEQAQNSHADPDATPPADPPPAPPSMSALGLTAYRYSLDTLDEAPLPADPAPEQGDQNGHGAPLEVESGDPPSPALEQGDQNGHGAPLEVESGDSPSPAPPAKRGRSHKPKATAIKRQPRRRTGASKASS